MKEYYLKKISKIIFKEFNKLFNSLDDDFKINYEKKRSNFIINGLGDKTIAYLSFVSSFESKYGNSMENIAKKICRLRYKKKYINIINPNKLIFHHSISKNQIVITNLDLDSPIVNSRIKSYLTRNEGKDKTPSTLDNKKIKGLLKLYNQSGLIKNIIYEKPVDLAFYDDDNILNLIELKAGGELDSSNAPSNIEKLLKIYVAANDKNAKIYFATLYNKSGYYINGKNKGKRKLWTGAAKKYLKFPEMFLIEEQFWEKILPKEISFNDFNKRYQLVLNKMKIDEKILRLIKNTVK